MNRYLVFNKVTGNILFEGFGSPDNLDAAAFGPGVEARVTTGELPFDHYKYDEATDDFIEITPPTPEQVPATWRQIRDWRDSHEIAPVATSFGAFDADERSDARMAGSIELFDTLPTLDAQNRLTWKRADNSFIPLTKTELESVYAELKTNRAARGALLHVKAEIFRNMNPTPTPAQLSDIAFWLEE